MSNPGRRRRSREIAILPVFSRLFSFACPAGRADAPNPPHQRNQSAETQLVLDQQATSRSRRCWEAKLAAGVAAEARGQDVTSAAAQRDALILAMLQATRDLLKACHATQNEILAATRSSPEEREAA